MVGLTVPTYLLTQAAGSSLLAVDRAGGNQGHLQYHTTNHHVNVARHVSHHPSQKQMSDFRITWKPSGSATAVAEADTLSL